MDCSTPGLPVHHQLSEFTQTHVHWVSNAIEPSHPLWSTSPAFNFSQHQGLFQWVSQFFTSDGESVGSSTSASVLPMNIQGWFLLGLTGWISFQSKGFSRVFSSYLFIYHYCYYYYFTLQYCICFDTHQHESATGVHRGAAAYGEGRRPWSLNPLKDWNHGRSRSWCPVPFHWYQKIFQLLFSYRENELCAGRIWKYCFDSLILQVKV